MSKIIIVTLKIGDVNVFESGDVNVFESVVRKIFNDMGVEVLEVKEEEKVKVRNRLYAEEVQNES